MCNKCQEENICSYKKKNTSIRDLSSDSILYTGNGLSCSSVQTNTSLTQALEAIDNYICESQSQNSQVTDIVNVGTGSVVYAGENNIGQKQLKSFKTSQSITFSNSSTEVTAVVDEDWLATKVTTTTDQTIVAFNTTNPNSGSPIFTPNDPQDTDVIYWSTSDNSYWVWNGTAYVTYTPPSTSPFYIAGTTTDAGANKLANIQRTGRIGIGITPQYPLHVSGSIAQSNVTSALIKADAQGQLIAASSLTDYLTPTGSAANLTNFPTFNQNTTGNAATVTTNANLSGDVTSVGNVTTLSASGVTAGSYTNANLTVDAKGRVTSISDGGGARTIEDIFVDQGTSNASLTGLYEIIIDPDILNNDGDKLKVHYSGTLSSPGVTKILQFQFGTSTYSYNTTLNGTFRIQGLIMRTSNTSVRVSLQFNAGNASGVYDATWTGSIDFTGIMSTKLNAQGGSTNDVVGKIASVEFVPTSA